MLNQENSKIEIACECRYGPRDLPYFGASQSSERLIEQEHGGSTDQTARELDQPPLARR